MCLVSKSCCDHLWAETALNIVLPTVWFGQEDLGVSLLLIRWMLILRKRWPENPTKRFLPMTDNQPQVSGCCEDVKVNAEDHYQASVMWTVDEFGWECLCAFLHDTAGNESS